MVKRLNHQYLMQGHMLISCKSRETFLVVDLIDRTSDIM